MEKKVGIVGGGISGLLACKYVLSKGFVPIVFESQTSLGGVWTKTIETTKLQTPKPLYQFSDFPWPSSVSEVFPDTHQVLHYVQSYAHHFGLITHIRFNSKVTGISYNGHSDEEMMTSWSRWGGSGDAFSPQGKWNISVINNLTDQTQNYEVDFVILCVGRFSDIPNIPKFGPKKGPENFGGKVIHSMEYMAMDSESAAQTVKGKHITVVGFQKSALDIAMECSTVNGVERPCTVVYKTAHWTVPNYQPWGVPMALLYFNRFSELLVHKPGETLQLAFLATLLSPLRWGISKFVESYIKWKLPLAKFGMVPRHSFIQELNTCLISTVPEDFYKRVEEGSIVLKKSNGDTISFCNEGVLIEGEDETLKTDMVILATGFRGIEKFKHIFESTTFQDCIADSPRVPLYRECIHPRIPQLAIIGFSESAANLYTSEMRCRWLAEFLDGAFKLPTIKEMEKDVARWDEYMKHNAARYHERSCIAAVHIWYNDQLCKDMGWNHKRKNGLFAELFEPYGPLDYASP